MAIKCSADIYRPRRIKPNDFGDTPTSPFALLLSQRFFFLRNIWWIAPNFPRDFHCFQDAPSPLNLNKIKTNNWFVRDPYRVTHKRILNVGALFPPASFQVGSWGEFSKSNVTHCGSSDEPRNREDSDVAATVKQRFVSLMLIWPSAQDAMLADATSSAARSCETQRRSLMLWHFATDTFYFHNLMRLPLWDVCRVQHQHLGSEDGLSNGNMDLGVTSYLDQQLSISSVFFYYYFLCRFQACSFVCWRSSALRLQHIAHL